jgi:tyrosyl-tRNA synthetase
MVSDEFIVKRDKKFGGDLIYKSYAGIENDFRNNKLHPLDLKKAVSKEINDIIKPVRKRLENKKDLVKKAYPDK